MFWKIQFYQKETKFRDILIMIKLFSTLKHETITEANDKENLEAYTGIILDPETNEFKIVSGMFEDKKDFYKKMFKQGYVGRKVFEKKVFDWIQKNAKTTLDAYLMFSTAFSKWKGNNMLSEYYVKLLNDIPELNREKIKGNPNSKVSGKTESVFNEKEYFGEDSMNDFSDIIQTNEPEITPDNSQKKDIEVYGIGYNGEIQDKPLATLKGIPLFDKNEKTPEFWKQVYSLVTTDEKNEYPKYAVKYVGDFEDPEIYSWRDIQSNYVGKVMNTNYKWDGWKTSDVDEISTLDKNINKMQKELEKASPEEKEKIQAQIDFSSQISKNMKHMFDMMYSPEQAKKMSTLKKQINAIQKRMPSPANEEEFKKWNEELANIKNQYDIESKITFDKDPTLSDEAKRKRKAKLANIQNGFRDLNRASRLYDIATGGKSIRPGNRIHGGDPDSEYIRKLDKHQRDILKAKETEIKLDKDIEQSKKDMKDLEHEYNTRKLSPSDASIVKSKIEDLRNKINRLTNKKNMLDTGNATDKLSDREEALVRKALNKMKSGEPVTTKRNNSWHDEDPEKVIQNYINNYSRKESADNSTLPLLAEMGIMPAGPVTAPTPGQAKFQPSDGTLIAGTVVEDADYEEISNTNGKTKIKSPSNRTINPKLFDTNSKRLKKDVKSAMIDVAKDFLKQLDFNADVEDIYFTGSCANYNYTDTSDIDLHLVFDYEKVGVAAEILSEYFKAKKKIYNTDHNIHIKDYPVEVGVEDINSPLASSGVYSLKKDEWIKEPSENTFKNADFDKADFDEMANTIEDVIATGNSDEILKVWKQVTSMRKNAIEQGGETAPKNLLFKKLRADSYLEKLKNAYNVRKDRELTLESEENS